MKLTLPSQRRQQQVRQQKGESSQEFEIGEEVDDESLSLSLSFPGSEGQVQVIASLSAADPVAPACSASNWL